MDVIAVIGDKLYHAAGSECARRLAEAGSGPLLNLSEAQAQEVGMEPCGVCVRASDDPASPSGH